MSNQLLRKVSYLFIAILVLLVWASINIINQEVQAAEGTSVSLFIPPVNHVGEIIEVELLVEQASNLAGFEATISFNQEQLSFTGAKVDNDITGSGRDLLVLGPVVNEEEAKIVLGATTCPVADCYQSWEDPEYIDEGVNGQVKLATFQFVANQVGEVELLLDEVYLVDPEGNSLAVDSIPNGSSLQMQPANLTDDFDLTDNRIINAADAQMLANDWLMAASGACLEQPAEGCPQDGQITVAALQLMLSHWGEQADTSNPLPQRSQSAAGAITLVVNNAGNASDSNPGDGLCQTSNGSCTLRAALQESNTRQGVETIHFDIRESNGSCPNLVIIEPTSELVIDDAYNDGLILDGYSQCGASPNTQDIVGNAQIKIEIDGNGASNRRGLSIYTRYNLIKGLAIYDFRPNQMLLIGNASYNQIQGNFLGTNAANTFSKSGSYAEGIHIRWSPDYIILGCGSFDSNNNYQACQSQAEFNAARNLVSGNSGDGVVIQGYVNYSHFVGNYIGLKQDGSVALRNLSDGIDFGNGPQFNWVGGNSTGERNIISGNNGDGVEFAHVNETANNYVVGNYIGVNATGSSQVRNKNNGVTLEDTVNANQVYNNVISGNGANGIRVYMEVTNSEIHDNYIGVAADGVTSMPNGSEPTTTDGRAGIYMMGGSQHNRIANNLIANNPYQGIHLSNRSDHSSGFDETFYNTISQNSIFNNGTSGIYLNPQFNPDIGQDVYPNEGLSAPNITNANTNNVSGTACANCIIEIFIADKNTVNDPSSDNFGEGKTFIGSGVANGSGNFVVAVSGVLAEQIVTGTATDSTGNTSAFARNVAVVAGVPTMTPTPTETVTPSHTPTATPTSGPSPTPTNTPSLNGTVEIRIANWADDAEERLSDGEVYRGSSDLELIDDPEFSGEQLVGLRFQNVSVPQGATITAAYLEFAVDETDRETTSLILHGEASDHALAFLYQTNNLQNRQRTTASVAWDNLPSWNTIHETHQSPDISPIMQEITSRPGWVTDNAIVIFVTGSGQRTAEAYDGSSQLAALLHIEYNLYGAIPPTPVTTHTPEPIPERLTRDIPSNELGGSSIWLPIIVNR